MKKGFTMIELIFVIVILGILASVAVPRLAGTKADAEISAAVANLRTLVSDANVYYVAKGGFEATGGAIDSNDEATQERFLYVGGFKCIGVKLENRNNNTPAYIKFTKGAVNNNNSGVCKQVLDAEPIKAYVDSTVQGAPNNAKGIAIGSSTSVY